MDSLYRNIQTLLSERGISGSKMCADLGLSRSLMSTLKSGRTRSVHPETARKIADYFGVSLERVLLGEGGGEAPRMPSDDELKFALFGGEGEITDAMFEEVKQFAAFVKAREEANKKG